MLKKTLSLIFLVMIPCFCWADGPSLDDKSLRQKFQKISRRISIKLSEKQRDPSLYKSQLKKLEALLASAADPDSGTVQVIRLFKASIHLELKQGEQGLAELTKIEAMKPNARIMSSIYQHRARYFIRKRDVGAMKKLVDDAKALPLDDKTLERLVGSYYLLKARELSKYDKRDEINRIIKDAEAARVDYKTVDLMKREIARCAFALGKELPDFKVKDSNGKELSIALYKGKVVLVDFWASWCVPCRNELPTLQKLYKKYHSKGFEIIGVSLDQKAALFNKYIKDQGLSWRQYFDGKGWRNVLARKYLVDALPTTFLLDAQGKVLAKDIRVDSLEVALKKALGIVDKSDE
jgi:thiol-disulfide isomerase/thioredoxin